MNQLHTMINEMTETMRKERSETQMTLGKMIERLKTLPAETPIFLSEPHSYRGYYADLAFQKPDIAISAARALALCQECVGKSFEGYKGGDYVMGNNAPVWQAYYGQTGMKIDNILDDGTIELSKEIY